MTEEFDKEEYFRYAVLTMLHRQYEVLLQIAHAAGVDQDSLKEMVEAHDKGEYEVPFKW